MFLPLLSSVVTIVLAGDLSKYRNFELGMDLPRAARLAGANLSHLKVIQSRPFLLQDLDWRTQPLGSSAHTEPAKDVTFSFYDGKLFRIVVSYDRYETEGLTPTDLVESISATYGAGTIPAAASKSSLPRYDDQDEVLARWEDAQHRFELIRSSYRNSFKLIGVLKRLESPVQASILEAARLDDKEAPQRETERFAKEQETERAKMEKARLVNKPRFRP
ncbi:MAG TPA: hypothetical protein VM120_10605 [Bryobacteraceae bacterium]|nr:hypothetical protein [Bryobacteraceae bacterium]